MFERFRKRKAARSDDALPAAEEASGAPVGWVRTRVPQEELLRQLKAPKDVRVSVFSAGAVAAACKACAEQIEPAEKDGLLWLVCPRCQGKSFVPLANLPRDVRWAAEADGVFEYEAFFVRDLPAQFSPPDPSHTDYRLPDGRRAWRLPTELSLQHTSQPAAQHPTFVFTVELVFYIQPPVDRVMLTGIVDEGAVKVGDSLTVQCRGLNVPVVVEVIQMLDRGLVQEAGQGQEVGLRLKGLRKELPAPGDRVVGNTAPLGSTTAG